MQIIYFYVIAIFFLQNNILNQNNANRTEHSLAGCNSNNNFLLINEYFYLIHDEFSTSIVLTFNDYLFINHAC